MKKSVFCLLAVLPLILQAQVPIVTSFSPQQGPIGTTVTLSGSNFNTTPGNNMVFFGGVEAMVSSATLTELIVEVPDGASYDFISVTVGGLIAQTNRPFIVTFESDEAIGRSPDTFADEVTFEAGNEPYGVDAGDLDGDGLVDLVTGNFTGASLSIFRNTSSGPGDINFATRSDVSLIAQANDLKLTDFDGDGKLDVALVTEDAMGTTYLEILRNTTATPGSIGFTQDVTITHDGYNYSIDAADFNRDGKVDIVVLDADNARLSVYENSSTTGLISFADDVDFAIGSDPYDVTIGDINDDGLLDLITLDGTTNTVSVLENTSTGGSISFAAKVDFAVNPASSSSWLAVGDLNGDDLPEVVVQNGASFSIFKNETSAAISFSSPQEIAVTITNGPISLEDFNGDGKPDLLLNGQINQLVLLKNTSSGSTISFAVDVKFSASTNQFPITFITTDLDGDGESDIVGTTYNGTTFSDEKIEVLRNHSAKGLITAFSFAEETAPATIDVSARTIEISVAGVPDLTSLKATFDLSLNASASVVGNPQTSGSTSNDFTNSVVYTILAEDGSSSQDWVVTVSLECLLDETSLTEVACDSYDFDGQVISTSGVYTRAYINRFGCDSTVTVDLTINPTSFFENVYAVGSYDFDDATLNTSGQYTYGPFTSTETGCDSTFFLNLNIEPDTYDSQEYLQFQMEESTFPVIEQSGASHMEDVDGDGEKDLFIIGKSESGVIASLYINNGDGTFTEKTDHGISGARVGNRTNLFLDANGDDVLDFLVIGKAGGAAITKLYINDGLANFTEKTAHGLPDLGLQSITSYLDSADVDGDDDLDLVISIYDAADYDSYQSQLYLNNGDGSFVLSTVNDFPALQFSLADFADFDRDGDQDLLLRGSVEPYKIWLNDGTGVFTPKLDRSLATLSSRGMVIFDADGDGDLDIYDSNTSVYSSLYTSMYFNNGDGSFTHDLSSEMPRLDGYAFEAGNLSQARDLDHDGDLDLIMEGRYRFSGGPAEADYLEVWLNNGFGHFKPLESRTLNEVFPTDSYQFGQELGYANYQSNKLLNVYDFDRDGRLDILLSGQEYYDTFERVTRFFYNKELSSEMVVVTCNSYEFDGVTLTTSGNYQGLYTDGSGTTYPTNLDLTILISTTSEETMESCESYDWNGVTYTTSGTYEEILTNAAGCDSTATLNLTILEPTSGSEEIEACESYEWEGTLYTASGTYQEILTNAASCDSTATLNLTILEPTSGSYEVEACESYEWEGTLYTDSGTYQEILTNSAGCDSIATLILSILEPTSGSYEVEVCESYDWEGTIYTVSGTYQEILTNTAGCDSTATLYLTILEPTSGSEEVAVCESYEWEGTLYTTSGTYQQLLTNDAGCDSTATLTLTILEPTNGEADVFACGSYEWHGITYTESGTFDQLLTNVAGCDSTATLNLILGIPTFSESEITSCESYEWNGKMYSASGVYSELFTNAAGCDSTATLNLTINETIVVDQEVVACEGYEFNGEMISTSGEYTATFENAMGCDSLVNLSLTIDEPYFSQVNLDVCGSYEFGEQLITESGIYLENFVASNGCDSLVSLTVGMLETPDAGIEQNGRVLFASDNSSGLSYQWYDCSTGEPLVGEDKRQLTPPRAGTYFVEVINSVCQVTSTCLEVSETSLILNAEKPFSEVEIYPNPSTGPVHLRWGQTQSVKLTVIGLNGRVVYSEAVFRKQETTLSLDVAGLYLIRIQDSETGEISDHKVHIR